MIAPRRAREASPAITLAEGLHGPGEVAIAGDPFFEKPPLLYWLMSIFLRTGIDPVLAVVGAGHAGCEAGLAAARMGLRCVWVDRDLTGHPAKLADRAPRVVDTGELMDLAAAHDDQATVGVDVAKVVDSQDHDRQRSDHLLAPKTARLRLSKFGFTSTPLFGSRIGFAGNLVRSHP